MRRAVIVFTKVPKAGDIKTRLTTERGGILTPEEAKELYEAFLLDVLEACIAADSGDVWICYNQSGDRNYFNEFLDRLSEPNAIKGIFPDQGGVFDDCIQYAADYILKNGSEDRLADALLLIGGDLPGLQPLYIQNAFAKMEQLARSPQGLTAAKKMAPGTDFGAALVEGSCQEGGFSIVGFTCNTPFDFQGIFYNQDGGTALDMLVNKADERQIPFGFIQNVPDVDIPVDLASIIPELGAIRLAARFDPTIKPAKWTSALLEETGLATTTAVNIRDNV
ncbi:MAG TPA: DUF2064 domain-containing protein [Syntrophomonadaceae bacterium]|nr:DUF2064 domain-containing protein [Syntrophomonadaceae bacterium]